MAFPLLTLRSLKCCIDQLFSQVETAETSITALQSEASAPTDYTLVAGTVAVADTSVTATSKVTLTRHTIGGSAGNLSYTVSDGVGVTINSSSNTDTSVVTAIIHY